MHLLRFIRDFDHGVLSSCSLILAQMFWLTDEDGLTPA